MLRRKRRLTLALLTAVAAAGLIGVHWTRTTAPEPRLTMENFRRIAVGMTERQCRQILGAPKGEPGNNRQGEMPACLVSEWAAPDQQLTAFIVFDATGRVEGGVLDKGSDQNGYTTVASLNVGFVTDTNESLLVRICRLLGL